MRRCCVLAVPFALTVLASCAVDVVTTAVSEPELRSITPDSGVANLAHDVEIQGTNLLPLVTQDVSLPEGVRVDVTFQAWLGTTALQQVTYVDDEHLTATVPAGLAPGVYALKVETPHGLQATLADAFEVLPGTGPTINSVLPANLINDQDGLLDVVGSGFDSGTSAELEPASGPTIALAVSNLNTAGFTATVAQGTAAGSYALRVTTGAGQSVLAQDTVHIWEPAALVASLAASPAAVHTGDTITLRVTVRNEGGSTAQGVRVGVPATSGSGTATHFAGPTPAQADIAAGASQSYSFSFAAQGSGSVAFAAQASGTNIHSLRPVVSNVATSPAVDIVVGASLIASLNAPLAVVLDQIFDVTLTVQNTGAGQATGVTPSLALTGSGALTLDAGPTPASVDLDGGQSQVFTYTYRATGLGNVTFTANVSGTDVVNGTTVAAPEVVRGPMTVQQESALEVIWQTPSATAVHGQAIDLVLRATNSGGSAVQGVSASTAQVTGGTGTTCGAAVPASADLAAAASQNFTYSCTVGNTSGSWTLIANAQGTDALTSQTTVALPAETAPFVAVAPAALTLQWQALPAQVAAGQDFTAVLRATNSGGSGALAVAPTGFVVNGATGTSCSAPAPASADVQAGANADFSYDCTAGSTSGSFTLSAGADGTAALGGAAVTAAAVGSSSVEVRQPAALSVISVTSPASDVYQGQAGVQVSVLVENTGEVAADFTAVAAWLSFTQGSTDVGASFTVVPAGGNPASVAGGAQATVVYAVAVSETAAAGAVIVDAVATGTDSLTSAAVQSAGAGTTLSWNVIANTRPVACFSAPSVAVTGASTPFDASCSTDGEDLLADLTVAWDLDGDGAYEQGPGTTKTTNHSYSTVGAYTVGARITDTTGTSAYASAIVVVADASTTMVVTTTANELDGGETATPPHQGTGLSLREAITLANNRAGRDTIRFDPTVFPSTGALIATGNTGLPNLTDNTGVQIVGHTGVRVSCNANTSLLSIQSDNNVIARMEIFGATNNGEFCLQTGTGATDNWFFENNVHDCRTALDLNAGPTQVGPGNRFDAVNTGVRGQAGNGHHIYGNTLTGCGSRCVFIDAGNTHTVERNLFYRPGGGTGAEAIELDATTSNFWHNTVHNFTGNGLDLRGSGHDVKNNIFTNNATAAIADSSGLTAASSDYNACFGNGGTGCGATSGTHTVLANPQYVNAGSLDFRLQAGSPCVDTGTDLGLDVNGVVPGSYNGAAPDMGARER